jgi:energy-coupling factor transporter ATP-binding protein EcfA2
LHRARAGRLIERFDVRGATAATPAGSLSGGNQQKLLLARELDREPRALVLLNPTRGLDVGASRALLELLDERRRAGAAILLVSTELEELLSVSDRVAVLFRGRIAGESRERERLGALMLGEPRERRPGRSVPAFLSGGSSGDSSRGPGRARSARSHARAWAEGSARRRVAERGDRRAVAAHGLAVLVAFRAGFSFIGAEGQFICSAIAAAGWATTAPAAVLQPAILVAFAAGRLVLITARGARRGPLR